MIQKRLKSDDSRLNKYKNILGMRVMTLLIVLILFTGCSGQKELNVDIKIEDYIGLNYDYIKNEEGEIIDTMYRLETRIKLNISPQNKSDIFSVSLVEFIGEYFNCTGSPNFPVYFIDTNEKDRSVIFNERDVITGEDYYHYYYGMLHCIEPYDVKEIENYFKKKGIESISLSDFKKSYPSHFDKYLKHDGDKIILDYREVNKFRKVHDDKREVYILDYTKPYFNYALITDE